MTDYERTFRHNPQACGAPFEALVRFFADYEGPPLSVLDLGCGQGRDALMIARSGHAVLGVDLAPTGVAQMLAAAEREALNVRGVVADVRSYEPAALFDVVILDRVVHMLRDAAEQEAVLIMAGAATKPGGHVLIADTPSNLPRIDAAFAQPPWHCTLHRKGFRFYRRSA